MRACKTFWAKHLKHRPADPDLNEVAVVTQIVWRRLVMAHVLALGCCLQKACFGPYEHVPPSTHTSDTTQCFWFERY
jgi:hypothetical protein